MEKVTQKHLGGFEHSEYLKTLRFEYKLHVCLLFFGILKMLHPN